MSRLMFLLYAFCLASTALALSLPGPEPAARRSTGKYASREDVAGKVTGKPDRETPAVPTPKAVARKTPSESETPSPSLKAAVRNTPSESETPSPSLKAAVPKTPSESETPSASKPETSTGSSSSGGSGGLVGLLQLFSAENIHALEQGKIPEVIRSHIPSDLLKAIESLKPADLDALKVIAVDQLVSRKYSSVRKLLAAIKEKAPEVHEVVKQGIKTGYAVLKKIESDVGPKVWGNVIKTYNAARDVAKTAAVDYLKLDSETKSSLKAKFPYSLLVELFDDPLFGSFYNLIVNDGKQIKA